MMKVIRNIIRLQVKTRAWLRSIESMNQTEPIVRGNCFQTCFPRLFPAPPISYAFFASCQQNHSSMPHDDKVCVLPHRPHAQATSASVAIPAEEGTFC